MERWRGSFSSPVVCQHVSHLDSHLSWLLINVWLMRYDCGSTTPPLARTNELREFSVFLSQPPTLPWLSMCCFFPGCDVRPAEYRCGALSLFAICTFPLESQPTRDNCSCLPFASYPSIHLNVNSG